jgi:hypothetical protein
MIYFTFVRRIQAPTATPPKKKQNISKINAGIVKVVIRFKEL